MSALERVGSSGVLPRNDSSHAMQSLMSYADSDQEDADDSFESQKSRSAGTTPVEKSSSSPTAAASPPAVTPTTETTKSNDSPIPARTATASALSGITVTAAPPVQTPTDVNKKIEETVSPAKLPSPSRSPSLSPSDYELSKQRQHSGEQRKLAEESMQAAAVEDNEKNAFGKPPMITKTSRTALVSYSTEGIEDEEDRENESLLAANQESEEATDSAEFVDEDDVRLPPSPPGHCSISVQDKIAAMYKQYLEKKTDFTAQILQKKESRNPSIYEKLVLHCNIDESGTNYPKHLYDPKRWKPEEYYDELAKAQRIEMDKREKERKERTKVEFVSGTKKRQHDGRAPTKDSSAAGDNTDAAKRKSKWDQTSGKSSTSSKSTSKPTATTTTTSSSTSQATKTSSSSTSKHTVTVTTGMKKKLDVNK